MYCWQNMTLISIMYHNNWLQAKPILPGTCAPAESMFSNPYLQFHDPNKFHKLHRVGHGVNKAGVGSVGETYQLQLYWTTLKGNIKNSLSQRKWLHCLQSTEP